jgi:hypothetical protein
MTDRAGEKHPGHHNLHATSRRIGVTYYEGEVCDGKEGERIHTPSSHQIIKCSSCWASGEHRGRNEIPVTRMHRVISILTTTEPEVVDLVWYHSTMAFCLLGWNSDFLNVTNHYMQRSVFMSIQSPSARSLHYNLNNILQRMHFQYILYCIFTSTPTCFGPIGPYPGSYVQ